MRVSRDLLLKRLIDYRDTNPIKIITGIRRCGKSYMLNELYRDYLLSDGVTEDHIISIDLELRSNKALCEPDVLLDHIIKMMVDDGMYYVFLDEIQLVKDFESVVNEINSLENTDVYITGSNSKFLSSDIITEFRGRGVQVHIRPLSFSEYYSFKGGDKMDAWDEYCVYGGMPGLIELKSPESKAEYLQNLLDAVYLNDVVDRNGLRGSDLMGMIMNSLFSSIGSLTNPNKTCNFLKTAGYRNADNETVSKYMSTLEDAFIFERCDRYDIKGKGYFSTPSKYYVVDVGLRNAGLRFRQNELTHITENIVYNELRNRGYLVDVGMVSVRDKDGYKQLEIDFIANKGNKRYYIQSAFSCSDEEKKEQEVRPLIKVNDSFKKIIVTGDRTLPWTDENGILTINVLDFLLDQDSLNL